jgi:hypothetical protein
MLPPEVRLPEEIAINLSRRVADLAGRMAALKSHRTSDLLANGGFEAAAIRPDEVPGWVASRQTGAAARLETSSAHEGKTCLLLSSTGPVASLASEPITPPSSGRLLMMVHLRASQATRQPALRLAVEGVSHGQAYYRHAAVGAGAESARPISSQWEQFVVPFADLPTEGTTQLRVRFDLMGAGEVWIDQVQLSSLHFTPAEQNELLTVFQAAQVSLQEGKVSSARRLLNSYWPTLLERHVPAPPRAPEPARPEPAQTPPPSQPEAETGLLDRAKDWIPRWMRF